MLTHMIPNVCLVSICITAFQHVMSTLCMVMSHQMYKTSGKVFSIDPLNQSGKDMIRRSTPDNS